MSRSGYSDDIDDNWALIKWRGAVKSAIRGARGQAFLRELLTALDTMPEKALASSELQADGTFCALGVVGQARGLDLTKIDTEDWQQLSIEFGIAQAMAREIMFENDACIDDFDWVDLEVCGPMRPHYPEWGRHSRTVRVPAQSIAERRWSYMRTWVASQLAQGAQR